MATDVELLTKLAGFWQTMGVSIDQNKIVLVKLALLLFCGGMRELWSQPGQFTIFGNLRDPQSRPVPAATVTLVEQRSHLSWTVQTDTNGRFTAKAPERGAYTVTVTAPYFRDLVKVVVVEAGSTIVDLQLGAPIHRQESVSVMADVKESNIFFPDPGQKVYARQEVLSANPGRPGAPISIPGVPIESASGGIKAPQYFAPGVAGDHGEPIAQYIQVGSYLVSNNLSANAHGNGYADPNILIPPTLEGVLVDGGAFNVREGNHAVNLATIYEPRSRLEPFVTITGDYRDADAVLGWSPKEAASRSWIAIEAAYGNGFLRRLEHRQQYKVNGYREWIEGTHTITLFGIGYFGNSYIPGLVPLGIANPNDTIDARQKDQTHTGEAVINDQWHLRPADAIHLSGFFRTYNLALDSNFGEGLIRQSEFRTVTGGNAVYTHTLGDSTSMLVGADYQRDAPRRLNLDHYSADSAGYGSLAKVTANNVTIQDAAPYVALDGAMTRYFHYDLGWRRDEVQFRNDDLLNTLNSFATRSGVNSPKATLSFRPGGHDWLPSVSLSFGEAFYTNDPRIGIGGTRGTPVSREHSYQLIVSKILGGTDFRLTLGHLTSEASLAKIDADTGLQEDEGPARNRFVTFAARRSFRFGFLQGQISKADARNLVGGLPIPEAPRLIVDVLGALNQLPFELQARAEYEEVGRKPLGDGLLSVPVREFRGALARSFGQGRMDLGLNILFASGYTGQTEQLFQTGDSDTAMGQVAGVRLRSYVSVSYTYNFDPHHR